MAETPSTMLDLGTKAPDFRLPDTEGKEWTLADFDGADALVVAFICNHCPFVKHIADVLAEVAKKYAARNVAFVAVNSNDVKNYPADAPDKMAEEKKRRGYPFPYLYDESQEVAKAYRAACTPDFYLFDKERKLAYRGRFDESRPGNAKPVTGQDLATAINQVLKGEDPDVTQFPSMGCNIKWKPGNEPDYFG